jgi:hypothetical protein
MPGLRTALFALVVLGLFALLYFLFRPGSGPSVRDADLVYCLAPAHQAGLVDAAESLDLISTRSTPAAVQAGGPPLTLSAWVDKDTADFRRACDAYAAPAFQSGSSGSAATSSVIDTLLAILLPVAAGALLTLSIDEFKQGSDRRFAQPDELREAWEALRDLIDSYVEGTWTGSASELPKTREIDAARRVLDAKLATVLAQHRKSPSVKRLKKQLQRYSGARVAAGWSGGGDAKATMERAERAEMIRTDLEEFDALLQAVAGKLERRTWRSSKL